MNSRGIDIAITTIVLIVIGIAVLIGLVFFVKNGFGFLKSGTEPLLKTESLEATRQACNLLCNADNNAAFCCESISLNNEEMFCNDSRLDVNCNVDCSSVVCG